ncbi:50S ribosomal protein L9 [Anaerotalea alkaliphila]|uniref:Large ribosomal subunit protein bL9 n=1 Tax=Anaerotalea alkaliphila TaxID=2662126 RepID=A0A7X5KM84_9FIRM|nr:50S ribosomal protein L9 [Anaerotalea alkaliphila]NDL66689.1 50S ribosomal protein L9 [Anaerotalea alkaliphila]
MKIVLLQDVKNVGKKGDVVEVSEGYARNFLIAKKYGIEATSKTLNDIKLKNAAEERRQQEILEEAKALAETLKEASITIRIKAGEGGRIFGSVSTKEIIKEIEEQLQLKIDKKKLLLGEPIKALGTTMVPVKLHPKVTAELAVKVVEEE